MSRYIIKRLLMIIPVMIGVSFILFSIMSFTPGSPARLILGDTAAQEDVEALEEEMGLDDPFMVQYFRYVTNVFKGDFGKSYIYKEPVFDEIIKRFPTTLMLAFLSLSLAIIIALPLGIISAIKQSSPLDTISMVGAMLGAAIPNFWLGFMLILVFALKLRWVPSFGVDSWKGFILPVVTLSAATIAILTRTTRSSMLEVIRQDYIRTARGKGARELHVIIKHAINNALIPVITVAGMNFGILLGGAVIIETVFSIPGLGFLMTSSIRGKDIPMVMAGVLFFAFAFSIVNLLMDLSYTFISPTIKANFVKRGAKK